MLSETGPREGPIKVYGVCPRRAHARYKINLLILFSRKGLGSLLWARSRAGNEQVSEYKSDRFYSFFYFISNSKAQLP